MRRFPALLAVVIALLACSASQHDEARWGVIRVRVEGCLSPHLEWADEALAALGAVGPTWRRVDVDEDVVLACVDLPASCGCAGQTTVGSRVARIDEARVGGHLEWLHTAEHELLHTQGLVLHVCRLEGEDPAGCAPVGFGEALLNPSPYDPRGSDGVTTVAPTQLDLAEWLRVHP